MRQLYQAVAIPKMLYVADLWFSLVHREGTNNLQWGSIGIAKKLSSIQCIAALAITGAMKTTATNLLEVHANLLVTTQQASKCDEQRLGLKRKDITERRASTP
jgi:hypothetical protein